LFESPVFGADVLIDCDDIFVVEGEAALFDGDAGLLGFTTGLVGFTTGFTGVTGLGCAAAILT
jgi:hypothetical protein